MLPVMMMLMTPMTLVIGRIDSSGRVASFFSLFGVLMPKGRSSSLGISRDLHGWRTQA
jgi:hypothetical protein